GGEAVLALELAELGERRLRIAVGQAKGGAALEGEIPAALAEARGRDDAARESRLFLEQLQQGHGGFRRTLAGEEDESFVFLLRCDADQRAGLVDQHRAALVAEARDRRALD